MNRRSTAWLAAGLAILIVAAASILRSQRPRSPAEGDSIATRTTAPPLERSQATPPSAIDEVASPASVRLPESSAKTTQGAVVELILKDVAGREIHDPPAQIRVLRAGEEVRGYQASHEFPIRIRGLAPGRCEIRARVDGFDEALARLELPPDDAVVPCELCLTPETWIGVIVQDAAGRSVKSWSEEWGGRPQHFFRGTFHVFLTSTPPVENAAPAAGETRFAEATESREGGCTPASCVGFVARERGATVWVGLAYLGAFLGWESADPASREVKFVIESSALQASFAELRFRVLRSPDRAPVLGAKVSLLSDSSKHRRDDQKKIALDQEGRACLLRLVPEDYELRIEERGPNVAADFVQRLALAPGERRDLGDILLSSDPPILVRVLDAEGQPIRRACVQMGPLVEGTDEDTIYSVHGQPRSFNPDKKGEITIPRPSYRAVVRATARFDPRVAMADFSGPRSANVLLDDSAVAGGVLTLTVQNIAPVEFTWTPRLAGSTAEIRDGVGAIVARGALGPDARWRVELLPANYVLTAKGSDGREVARADFRVDPGGATVALQ